MNGRARASSRGALRGPWRLALVSSVLLWFAAAPQASAQPPAPAPLIAAGQPVDWWFVFKFNAAAAPTDPNASGRVCPFGGTPRNYRNGFSQRYEAASSVDPTLSLRGDLVGTSDSDPVGATFAEIYNGDFSYVIWNDQFYGDPPVPGCSSYCRAPWAHSKGVLAWDDQGDGLVMQVTTPSWPASGSPRAPRESDGNTLGCVRDSDVKVSQDFFALRLSAGDVSAVLRALENAGVVTLPNDDQVVHLRSEGPAELRGLAQGLGNSQPPDPQLAQYTLSTNVRVISKPATLHAPPWQLVSAALGGEPLRVASWWTARDRMPSTNGTTGCWDRSVGGAPGRVEIAETGTGPNGPIGLEGGNGPNGNHAKIGVSLPGGHGLTIFGDMNQTGGLASDCGEGQDARGGLFFVVSDPRLHSSVSSLLAGDTAPDGDRTAAEGGADLSR